MTCFRRMNVSRDKHFAHYRVYQLLPRVPNEKYGGDISPTADPTALGIVLG